MPKRKPIRVGPFKGMYTRRTGEGDISAPRVILNADVGQSGRLSKRRGYKLIVDLPGAHSLYSDGHRMYCADGTHIYQVDEGGARPLVAHNGPADEPVSWASAGNVLYFATPYTAGRIDSEGNVHDWTPGRPPAVAATVSSTGSLPAGAYHLAYTLSDDVPTMGAGDRDTATVPGPVRTITVPDGGALSLIDRPDGATLWMSDPDGPMLYRVGPVDAVDTVSPTVEPMPDISLRSRPAAIRCLAFAFGRMWAGSASGLLYYSEPFRPTWFRADAYFDLGDAINLIAAVNTGLFVGTVTHTVFLEGTVPSEMAEKPVGPASIRGTLQYVDGLMEMGDMLSPKEKIHQTVPVWLQSDGIVAGNDAGRVFGLTHKTVRMAPPPDRPGASLFRRAVEGLQYLTSFPTGETPDAVQIGDSYTAEIIRAGEV